MRVVDHAQARIVAGFGSMDRANKRLLKLARAGLLRRFFLGSGGGRKALYSLSLKGARSVGVPLRGLRRPQNAVLVADYFVDHQLAVNTLYCTLKFGALPEGIAFRRWIAFAEWVTPDLPLVPDGYAELAVPAGLAAAFLEVDLGNESLRVWREKARKYLQLAISGAYRRTFGGDRFRVLVVANSARRMESLRRAVSGETEKIFRFATQDAARADFFGPVWKRPTGDAPEPLITPHP
ncbi:MAG: replication-relaxation family protein [Acidobacteriota bacterium]